MSKKQDDLDPKKEIARISATLEQPDKFAELFCKAAKSQTNVSQILQTIIRQSLQTDQITRDTVKDLIKEYEKEEWWVIIRRSFSVGWTAIVVIFSGALGYWIK